MQVQRFSSPLAERQADPLSESDFCCSAGLSMLCWLFLKAVVSTYWLGSTAKRAVMSVLINDEHIEILISESEIKARINHLAKEISDIYKNSDQLVVIGLLRGSFIFIADLVRRLNLPVEVDFITVSSYGNEMESSRQVRIIKDLETSIKNRDVLVVEDIIDTGHTLAQVLQIMQTRKPKSLSVCTLLNKPSRREIEVTVRWTGFDIPDEFVIGYGIDYAQQGRNLPHIGFVRRP